MTAPEIEAPSAPLLAPQAVSTTGSSALRRMLVFGTGFGTAIGTRHLEVAIVRSRASGPSLLGVTSVADFRSRPAAEWGAELLNFLAGANAKYLTATLVLPREETIVRALKIPGVADKDMQGAVELQIDT